MVGWYTSLSVFLSGCDRAKIQTGSKVTSYLRNKILHSNSEGYSIWTKIYNRKDWKGWIMYSPIYVFSLCMSGLGDNSLVIIQPHQSLYNQSIPNGVS